MFGQVIRHNKQGFVTQAEAFALHCCRCHLVGFARADRVCKQRITAVKNMSDSVTLMLSELDFGIHSNEIDVRSVVFSRAGVIEFLVIQVAKALSAAGV